MKFLSLFLVVLFCFTKTKINAQQSKVWNGRKCAVVLTYDDALEVHLDHVIPLLDAKGLKGTFYLIGDSPVVRNRLSAWRMSAKNGHELGNHSLTHPCDGRGAGRSWVAAENDLSRYSLNRVVNEIRITNTLLEAVDGKKNRTFAYPCGDTRLDTTRFYDFLKKDFPGARGVRSGLQTIQEVSLDEINSMGINGQTGAQMIDLVKQAMDHQALLVFLFHGVGGGHSLNVSLEDHRILIDFLANNQHEIWIAPLVEVAQYIHENKKTIQIPEPPKQ